MEVELQVETGEVGERIPEHIQQIAIVEEIESAQ